MKVGDKTFKVHLDGYNLTDALAGKVAQPAQGVLLLQRRRLARGAALSTNRRSSLPSSARIGLDVWQDPFVPLRFPKLFNLRSDPFETADHESIDYGRWRVDRAFLLVPAQQYVGQFLARSRNSRPARKPAASRSTMRCKLCRTLRKPPATDRRRTSPDRVNGNGERWRGEGG